MTDLTAGGVTVRRDSAGNLLDAASPVAVSDTVTTMLPSPDFTDEQKAMARLPLPFRNIIRDPFRPDIASTPRTTAYPQAMIDTIKAKGCSSFRIINPNSCPIRFRGAADLDDLIKDGEGRLLGPWQTEVFSTQNPTHLSVMVVGDAPAVLAKPELNYGIGG